MMRLRADDIGLSNPSLSAPISEISHHDEECAFPWLQDPPSLFMIFRAAWCEMKSIGVANRPVDLLNGNKVNIFNPQGWSEN